jgi:DNA-binding transcriptional regulator YhcF (GntR family)
VRVRVDPSSRTPVSVQLRDGIARRIVSGRLAPGDRVPPVRELAADLGLAPNTVAKAYRDLESTGHLIGRGRHGTFVAEVLPPTAGGGEALLEGAARAFAARARRLGVPPARALSAARRALRASPPG